jgi:hypothetical protein
MENKNGSVTDVIGSSHPPPIMASRPGAHISHYGTDKSPSAAGSSWHRSHPSRTGAAATPVVST